MIIHFINSYTFVTGKPLQVVNPVNYSPMKTIGLNKGRSQVLRAVLEIREKKRVAKEQVYLDNIQGNDP
ncbi:unnamed protein product [Brassica oleracea var. botrytis]|uniref:(rape) hypothetical protein n=1 Tax=Brassica napus TaxID=3708 RepID=A0A816LSA5_BRANA|nr:unnamed protein product [Brassica napus]